MSGVCRFAEIKKNAPPELSASDQSRRWILVAEQHLLCRFSDAGDDEARHTLGRAASEKRQGTKSREVRHDRCRGLYGDLAAALGWGG